MFLAEYTAAGGQFDRLRHLAETAGAAVWDVNNELLVRSQQASAVPEHGQAVAQKMT